MPNSGTQTRYRVTGALFLFALAAIFGPMLFDGAGLKGPEHEAMPEAKPAVAVVAPEGAFDGLEEVAERAAQLRTAVDDGQFEAEAESEALAPGPGVDLALAKGQQRPAEPGIAPLTADTAVWAIQVASFSNRENALALRASLRQQGYEAFLSDIKLQAKVLTRVAVGPYLNEADADRAQRAIAKRFDLEVQLVSMVI